MLILVMNKILWATNHADVLIDCEKLTSVIMKVMVQLKRNYYIEIVAN